MASHRRCSRLALTLHREDTFVGGRRDERLTIRPSEDTDILVAASANSIQIILEANSHCTVCRSDYKENGNVWQAASCGHIFHFDCVDRVSLL